MLDMLELTVFKGFAAHIYSDIFFNKYSKYKYSIYSNLTLVWSRRKTKGPKFHQIDFLFIQLFKQG